MARISRKMFVDLGEGYSFEGEDEGFLVHSEDGVKFHYGKALADKCAEVWDAMTLDGRMELLGMCGIVFAEPQMVKDKPFREFKGRKRATMVHVMLNRGYLKI